MVREPSLAHSGVSQSALFDAGEPVVLDEGEITNICTLPMVADTEKVTVVVPLLMSTVKT